MKRNILLLLFTYLFSVPQAHTQDFVDSARVVKLTLQDVIDLAKLQSPTIKYIQNTNVNYYWRWQNFQTNFRPGLSLSGDLPDYRVSTDPITQPDGSIEFRQISQLRTNTSLSMSQIIPQTGTTISGSSTLYRVQDYNNNTIDWSGSPFTLSFTQPLFAYNYWKWARKTEPLIYEESQKQFNESVEEVALATAGRFFDYLRIQTNHNLAANNLKNSEDNLKIAEVNRRLGRISENDYSKIKLSVLNASKSLTKANMDLKNADFSLKSYIGMDQNTQIELIIPLNMEIFYIDPDKALEETLANRKESPWYERRLISADRDLTQAKKNTGLATTLRGSYGTSKSSEEFPGVYQDTEKQQQIRLSLNIPILDWGKSASTVKLAESQRELVLYDVEREKLNFERSIIVEIEQFNLLKDQMEIANEADNVAENGYRIALKRFQNGEISITDLNVSLSDRETAKRDYIASIEDYWESYYYIRSLTLYDFIYDQKINYSNPSLSLK